MRPLDMSDDDELESHTLSYESPKHQKESAPPAKPPRPISAQQEAENTLREAFPTVDAAVIKAVLMASGGKVEPAFNALLAMSDPSAAVEETPPPQPPRPTVNRLGSTPQSQLEADEQYARQLAQHYDSGPGSGQYTRSGNRGQASRPQRLPERESNFLEDELPIITENIKKGFLETQSTVNSWITQLKNKIDGVDDHQTPEQRRPQPGREQFPGPRRSGDMRRSGDYNRYDADPQVLSDDFAGIQLNEDGSESRDKHTPRIPLTRIGQAQRRSTRPLANPDLFKPTPTTPKSEKRVAFQSNDSEDIYSASPKASAAQLGSGKQSKWQPLAAVDPTPAEDNDNDPFSLGDSEDENPNKDRVGGVEVKTSDADRLKRKASEVKDTMSGKKPEPAETSGPAGTKDKIAEELTK